MLEIKKLLVKQGNFTLTADLSIEFGDKVAIVGPSGGAKSTLLLTIAGFIEPVSGSIYLNRERFDKKAPSEIPCTMLFQDNNLFPHLNVSENVGLGLKPSLRLNLSERQLVMEALRKMNLETKASSQVSQLSGGQISRVAIARSLLQKKPLLLLDEPFAALGPAQRLKMINHVAAFQRSYNSILLMVTHNPHEAKLIANKVIFIEEGSVSKPQEIKSFFEEPAVNVQRYLGQGFI